MTKIEVITIEKNELATLLEQAAKKGATRALEEKGYIDQDKKLSMQSIDISNLPEILTQHHVAKLLGYKNQASVSNLKSEGYFPPESGIRKISDRKTIFIRDQFLAWMKSSRKGGKKWSQ